MTPEDTLKLFSEGKVAWNAWAEEMVAGRKALESERKWAVGWDEGLNDETRSWLDAARADFSGMSPEARENIVGGAQRQPQPPAPGRTRKTRRLQLVSSNGVIAQPPPQRDQDEDSPQADPRGVETSGQAIDFSGFVFPGDADFHGARFARAALFNNAQFHCDVRFAQAQFCGRVDFSGACFDGDALFDGALFSGVSVFCGARIKGEAEFDKAQFQGDALFDRAQFRGNARFYKTRFCKYADFFAVLFNGGAVFQQAEFVSTARFGQSRPWAPEAFSAIDFLGAAEFRGEADFSQAKFEDSADFVGARFLGGAIFRGVTCAGEFSLIGAAFKQKVPDFTQASFKNPPRMRDLVLAADVPPGGFWRSIFANLSSATARHPDLASQYRVLRAMAEQSHESRIEQLARRGEIRLNRRREDRPWHIAFWISLGYDALSDFGSSMVRPALVWALSIVMFAYAYLDLGARDLGASSHWDLAARIVHDDLKCASGTGDPLMEALYLSWKNALVFGAGASARIDEVHMCLYGAGRPQPVPTSAALLEVVQAGWSGVLIFLTLLAVSNRFRLK